MEKLEGYKDLVTREQDQPRDLEALDRQRGIMPPEGFEHKDFMDVATPMAQRAYIDAMADEQDPKLRRDTADRVFEMLGKRGKTQGAGGNTFVFSEKALDSVVGAMKIFSNQIKDVESTYETLDDEEEDPE